MEGKCGTSIAAVFILLVIPVLCFVIRGTHALIKWLMLRAGVRCRDTAFLLAFFLTPLTLIGAGIGLHFVLQWRGAI